MAPLATVLVISFSDLASDPRVDRQIAALRTRYQVIAAGLTPPGHDGVEFIDLTTPPLGSLQRGIGVARLLARRFESAYWQHPRNREALRRLSGTPADVVLVNEVSALPLGLGLGVPVALDAHEYAPEEFSDVWWWAPLHAPYVRWQCKRYLPQAAGMITVSRGIAEAYNRDFGVAPVVVTNAPPYADLEPGLVGEPVRILHHGAAQRGRGLEEMVSLGDLLEDRFTIDFVLVEGTPGLRDELIARARHNPRVRFPSPVPMRELAALANCYDIGLYSLPPMNFNQRYALPNKFFEFIQGRLAIAVGPSPEMASLVHQYGCGVVAPMFEAESLAAELNALDADTIYAFKRASHVAAGELNAERNAELLLGVVEEALGAGL